MTRTFIYKLAAMIFLCAGQVIATQLSTQSPGKSTLSPNADSKPATRQEPPSTIELGIVRPGESYELSFEFVNLTQDVLKPVRFEAGCRCVSPTIDASEIQPGETVTVSAQYRPLGRTRTDKRSFNLLLDGSAAPMTKRFSFVAMIREPISVISDSESIVLAGFTGKLTKCLDVETHFGVLASELTVATAEEWLTCRLLPPVGSEPEHLRGLEVAERVRLEIQADTSLLDHGHHTTIVVLRAGETRCEIPVAVDFSSEINGVPKIAMLGPERPSSTHRIMVIGARRLNANDLDVRCPSERYTTQLTRQGLIWELRIEDTQASKLPFVGEVAIRLSPSKSAWTTIPVHSGDQSFKPTK